MDTLFDPVQMVGDTYEQLVQQHTEAKAALTAFEQEHRAVLDRHSELRNHESKLRILTREVGQVADDHGYGVEF